MTLLYTGTSMKDNARAIDLYGFLNEFLTSLDLAYPLTYNCYYGITGSYDSLVVNSLQSSRLSDDGGSNRPVSETLFITKNVLNNWDKLYAIGADIIDYFDDKKMLYINKGAYEQAGTLLGNMVYYSVFYRD